METDVKVAKGEASEAQADEACPASKNREASLSD